MKRILMFAAGPLVFAVACLGPAQPASAVIFFDDAVDFNLSKSGVAGVVDIADLTTVDFFGRLASNGVNPSDGTPPAAGVEARVVGFGRDKGAEIGFGSSTLARLDEPSSVSFEVTTVIRDWNGRVESIDTLDDKGTMDPSDDKIAINVVYDDFVRTDAGDDNTQPLGTGFVDLYLDTSDDFDVTDAEKSSDGIWLATFGIKDVQGTSAPEPPRSRFEVDLGLGVLAGSGATRVSLELVAAKTDDLFTDAVSGTSLLGTNLALLSLIASTEEPIPNPPLINIFGGAGDPVDVGAGFDPPTASSPGPGFPKEFPADVVSKFDSSNTFEVVPEPSSVALTLIGGLSLCGLALRRRRKNAA